MRTLSVYIKFLFNEEQIGADNIDAVITDLINGDFEKDLIDNLELKADNIQVTFKIE